MDEERFRNWLAGSFPKDVVAARMANCRRVERFEGDLDSHWNADGLKGLLERLTYSKEDERSRRPPNAGPEATYLQPTGG